ncbi:hypothetical protein HII31_10494 [Pseudocercospora fuligena]|uniref:Uncharacterized protein n=1 Tax=Pseudocercospora fuligena TaxID=685502 RepID=A0A8H6RC37_9PEZI|nr:hypothetical protein HII31_10494 [Pseudocercospora fuligena]
MVGPQYDTYRFLPQNLGWRECLNSASDRVHKKANTRGLFDYEQAGRPPTWFLNAMHSADIRWFAHRDVQDILSQKIVNRKFSEGANEVALSFKNLHAMSVESSLTENVWAPYNTGAADPEGFTNREETNRERIEVGRVYQIFRLERMKSKTIHIDDVKCVITPDGVPGYWNMYRVLATAVLGDHWEGCLTETRDGRGMTAVASDERSRFVPVFPEGASYQMPVHSETAIFMTGTDGQDKNAIMDLRSKDFLYNKWVKPTEARPTVESWIRLQDLKKHSKHEQRLADKAIEKSGVSEIAVANIIAKGVPGPGCKYVVSGDIVENRMMQKGPTSNGKIAKNASDKRDATTTTPQSTSRKTEDMRSVSTAKRPNTAREVGSKRTTSPADRPNTFQAPTVARNTDLNERGQYPRAVQQQTGRMQNLRGGLIDQNRRNEEVAAARRDDESFNFGFSRPQPRDPVRQSFFESGTDASGPTLTAPRHAEARDPHQGRSNDESMGDKLSHKKRDSSIGATDEPSKRRRLHSSIRL